MSTSNPYAAPQVVSEPVPEFSQYPLATQGQRFANLIVDNIVTQFFSFIAGIVIRVAFAVIEGSEADTQTLGFQLISGFSGIGIMLAYYLVMEAAFGRTIGKLVTGTRVVSAGGGAASFGQIVGRTLCRLIPFEAFSFFEKEAVGWHDSIPKTRVIKIR